MTWSLPQIDEADLKQHELFGCWFDSQDASSQIFAEYHNCQFVPRRNVYQARANRLNQTLNEVKNQIIRDSAMGEEYIGSRKTSALTLFLFKEAGPLTAIAFMPVIVLVYLLALPAFGLGQMFVPGSMRVEMNLCSSTLALHLLWDIVHTFWALCLRMSNAWNVYMNVSMLLFSTQVNNSLYRDGMDAIASAFNIFFNLVTFFRLSDRAPWFSHHGARLLRQPVTLLSVSASFFLCCTRALSRCVRVRRCERLNIFNFITDLVCVVSRDDVREGEKCFRTEIAS